jgi:hypothetical protein
MPEFISSGRKKDTTYWKKQGSTSLTSGQMSYTNWSAGCENSVSVLGAFAYKADYMKNKISLAQQH